MRAFVLVLSLCVIGALSGCGPVAVRGTGRIQRDNKLVYLSLGTVSFDRVSTIRLRGRDGRVIVLTRADLQPGPGGRASLRIPMDVEMGDVDFGLDDGTSFSTDFDADDIDTDGDGELDVEDADVDGDGVGNDEDGDEDGDGVDDAQDEDQYGDEGAGDEGAGDEGAGGEDDGYAGDSGSNDGQGDDGAGYDGAGDDGGGGGDEGGGDYGGGDESYDQGDAGEE